jgi:hypothetical protein
MMPIVFLATTASVFYLGGGTVDPPSEVPETLTIRGDVMKVRPNDGLRALGFTIPSVPRDENAFWIYLDAINSFKDVPEDVQAAFDYAVRNGWPEGHDAKLKAYLLDPANQKALSLVRQASRIEGFEPCYFGEPGESVIALLLPSLSPYRHLAKMLVADGRRLEQQGAHDSALRNYETIMRMGHHVAQGCTLIEGLVGIACRALGDQAVIEMVVRRNLTVHQLREIASTLETLYPMCPSTVSGIENERFFGTAIVDEWTSCPSQWLRNLQYIGSFGYPGGHRPYGRDDGWSALEKRIGQLILPDRTIKRHMLFYYDHVLELAGKPVCDPAWEAFDEEATVQSIPRWNILARLFLPALSRAAMQGQRCRAQATMARLATALRLYSAENKGRLPRALAELSDQISEEDLVDPFSCETFAYKRSDASWKIWSFGENLVDDGGVMDENRRWRPDFVIRHPAPDLEPFAPEE